MLVYHRLLRPGGPSERVTAQRTWTTSPPSSGRTGPRSATTSTSTTFGANAWRGADGDEVIKRHTEDESPAHQELYIVLSGHATFTLGEDEVDAPAGTLVFVRDPTLERVAFAKAGRHGRPLARRRADGKAFEPAGWDTSLPRGRMIARVWRGATLAEDGDAYAAYVEETRHEGARASSRRARHARAAPRARRVRGVRDDPALRLARRREGVRGRRARGRGVLPGGRPLSRRARPRGAALRGRRQARAT